MILARNKSKRLSSVNHITKTIHHFHHHLTAKFDKKQARFQEINRSLDYPKFPEIRLNIPRNLLEHSPESSGTFPGIFYNILRNL